MKTIALEKGVERSIRGRKEVMKRRWSNDVSRCSLCCIASLRLSSVIYSAAARRDREETEATEECILFSRFFRSLFLSYLRAGERRKGERRRRILDSARLSSTLFIPTCFSPATFILFKVGDGEETDSEDRRGTKKKRRGTRLQV